MKIAVVTQYFPTSSQPWGGHSAYQTIRILAQRHDIQVFYPEAKYFAGISPCGHVPNSTVPGYHPDGIAVRYIPYPVLPIVSRPFNGWLAFHSLLPYVREFKPDIILNYVVYPDGFAAVRIGSRLGIPVVLTAIGSDLNRISDRICKVLTCRTLREANFITTVSNHLLDVAHTLGASPQQSCAILNGCDTNIFRPRDMEAARDELGIDAEGEVIVYVGRMDRRKGLEELVAATARLKISHPGLRCYLVGDGPDASFLQSAIERYQAASWITLQSPCSTERVATWMSAANLVALPSYNEGCPNVVIEALATGRPVVATNVGGIPELMDNESGRLVAPRDATALAAGLEEVLNSSWEPEYIASRHRRSWDCVAADIEDVLQRTLRKFPNA